MTRLPIRARARRTEPEAPVSPQMAKPRIGLALGGGGARGLAHILMLEAFEEMGIQPSVITGTSIGAIYGAAAAAGLKASLIRAHTEETLSQRFDLVRGILSARADPIQKLFNLLPLRAALLNPEALLELILPSAIPADFSALTIPLAVVATDFYAQEAVVLSNGPLRRAIAASMALPAIFQPVAIEARACVDGGLVNPLPFDLIGKAADITVAIDVSGASRTPDASGLPSAMETLFASSQILQRSIVREKLRHVQPDVYIDVDVDQFHVLEFHRYRDILAAAAPAKAALKRQLEKVLGSTTLPSPEPEPTGLLEHAPPPKKRRRLSLPRRRKK
jgi:NTE family protein